MDNFVAYVLPTQPDEQCPVVLCEYSKFQIKWNSYLFVFDSIWNEHNYSEFSYTCLFNRM